jgi:hypothetical protein
VKFKPGDRVIVKALYEAGSNNKYHPCKGVILPQSECKILLREGQYFVRFETKNYGARIDGVLTNKALFTECNIVLDTEYYREEGLKDLLDDK